MSRVLFATDLHLTDGQGGVDAFAADLEQIRALVPDLLVLGGDICLWQQSAGDRMQGLLQDLPFDIMYLMGNHDTDRDGTDTVFDRDFSTRYGSRNSYRQLAETEVIGLNTCRLQPWFDDWRNVRAEVVDSDLAWLDTTLSGLDRTRPLLLFVHIPLATTYPERRGADDDTTDVWRVTNADAVIERFTDWAGPIVVGQGHLHENEHLHEHGMHFVSVGSICGRWWQRGADSRCTDDSPRGWLVVDVEGGDIRLDYQAAGIDAGAEPSGGSYWVARRPAWPSAVQNSCGVPRQRATRWASTDMHTCPCPWWARRCSPRPPAAPAPCSRTSPASPSTATGRR
ncbi:MAG TPA: hypothetical protein EYQ31_01430 [Candidatus Handelsmanbacteria bacterium]|nr:hypothetical protein [Candidatus Handelsmanbacteria bacterium]